MNEAYLNINNVPTKVVTWGQWVEEDFQPNSSKDIVILIPGNPGITDFYKDFLQTIHDNTGFPVWAIGHAGHEPPHKPNIYEVPQLKGNEKLYGLEGQLQHKVDFIDKYVPKDARIHLIGHSIGCHAILKLLEIPSIKKRVVKNYLLFPTIEHMATTSNGTLLVKYVKHILKLVYLLAWIFTLFPEFFQNILLRIYAMIRNVDKKQINTIRHFINPATLEKVFFMAYDEMDLVKERNKISIISNIKTIKFYYGATDGWVPVEYYAKLKQEIPKVNAELCTRDFKHAFVLASSVPVGNMVSNWFQE